MRQSAKLKLFPFDIMIIHFHSNEFQQPIQSLMWHYIRSFLISQKGSKKHQDFWGFRPTEVSNFPLGCP